MIHILGFTLLIIALLAGCSSVVVPTREPATPSPTLSATTVLPPPTFHPDNAPLQPNQQYPISITFTELSRAVVQIYQGFSNAVAASFELENQSDDDQNPRFAIKGQTTGDAWAMPYVVHAVNVQAAEWERPYASIQAVMLLSPNTQNIALSLCNEYGGRGQFCNGSRLWLFDTRTGAERQLNLAESDLIFAYDLAFSDDSQILTTEGCLTYANAYFGYCGETAIATWDVATADLLDVVLVTTTP